MPWPLLVERASRPEDEKKRRKVSTSDLVPVAAGGWADANPMLAESNRTVVDAMPPPVSATWGDTHAGAFGDPNLKLKTVAEFREEQAERARRQRKAEADPRNAGGKQAFARALVTRAANAAAFPVTGTARLARAAGVPGLDRVADLDANEAYADAESLLRDEHVAQTRDRHRVTAEANPIATEVGGNAGDMLGGFGMEGLAARGLARPVLQAAAKGSRAAKAAVAPVSKEEIRAALTKQASGMRPESLKHLREGGPVHGGPVTVARFPGEPLHVVDGRHRLTVAAERGEPTVRGTVIEYGPRGGTRAKLEDVEIPTGRFQGGTGGRALTGSAQAALGGAPGSYADAREQAYRKGRDVSDLDLVFGAAQRAGAGALWAGIPALSIARPPKTTPRGKVYFDEARFQQEAPKILGQKLDDAAATRLMGHHPALEGEASYMVTAGDIPKAFAITMSHPKAQLTNQYYREGEDLVAYIDVVNLKPEVRQMGVGKELMRQQFAENDRLGVARADLLAAKDGRAAWPALGFELKRPGDFPRIRAAFDGWLREQGLDPANYPAEKVSEIARYRNEGRAFLTSPSAPLMDLTVDLRGESGRRLRAHLGLPEPGVKGSSKRPSRSSQSYTSSNMPKSSTPTGSSAGSGSTGGRGEGGMQ